MVPSSSSSDLAKTASDLHRAGRLAEAVDAYQAALEHQPRSAPLLNNLGAALRSLGRLDLAAASLKAALQVQPDAAAAWSNLGNVHKLLGEIDESLAAHRRAIELQPENAESHNNLALTIEETGDIEAALVEYRRAADLAPQSARIASNLLYAMHFSPECSAEDLLAAHRAWNDRFAEPIYAAISQTAKPINTAGRRIRIGYVSPDFRDHSVGRFILPLLQHHDRGAFEVFAYSDVLNSDAMTERIRSCVDHWRDITALDDVAAATQIRADGIDVLIDLTMHMARNRLLMFGRQPAPVQVSYLAYVSTTGLAAMKYRLTDAVLDPPTAQQTARHAEHLPYGEQSVRLPTYWSYANELDA